MPSLTQKEKLLVQAFLASRKPKRLPDYIPLEPPTEVNILRSLALPSSFSFCLPPTPIRRNFRLGD